MGRMEGGGRRRRAPPTAPQEETQVSTRPRSVSSTDTYMFWTRLRTTWYLLGTTSGMVGHSVRTISCIRVYSCMRLLVSVVARPWVIRPVSSWFLYPVPPPYQALYVDPAGSKSEK